MKFLKFAALFALATLSLLLARKGKEVSVQEVESEHIFDLELSGE